MLEVQTISISIERDWRQAYETIWRPQAFPGWASGLSNASLRQAHDRWIAQGPNGPITIRFTGHNEFGVMDHVVELDDGVQVYVPLRVIQHGAGAEVLLTLFRQPDMSDVKFAADADWIRRDLQALKALLESQVRPGL
jgi:hypothetical protein